MFKKSLRALIVLFIFLAVIYLSLPQVAKLTGFTISEQAANQAILTINPEQEIGVIRQDFYGANTGGEFLAGDMNTYGTKSGSIYLNVTEYRDAWINSGMKYIRADMSLENYYLNTSNSSGINFAGNLTQQIETVKWANKNNLKILYISGYMPRWLADNSSGKCTNLKFCPPINYTKWNNIILDFLDRVTVNGTYVSDIDIEVWNEPDYDFWMQGLSKDNSTKATNYYILYNSTYHTIKNKYSEINIGGPSLTWFYENNMRDLFLSNFSQQMDFLSFHNYDVPNDFVNFEDALKSSLNSLFNNCTKYNAHCSRIVISEWNDFSIDRKNNYINYHEENNILAGYYLYLLNAYPSNISSNLYQFAQPSKYSGSGQLWEMFSGSQLDNAYYPSYNVTKNFAHYHAGGDMVVNSSSDNSNIKVVSSRKSNGTYYITVISTSATNVDTNIDLSLTDANALQNLETGVIYPVSGGFANIGALQQYDVKYFASITIPAGDVTAPIIAVTSPTSKTYTTNSINIDISINELGICTYVLNSGTQNSMSTTNNLLFTRSESSLANGNYNLTASCIDLSGNGDTATVSFTINVSASSGSSSGSSAGGGGGGATATQVVSSNTDNSSSADITNGANNNNNGASDVTANNPAGDKQSNQTIKSRRGILGAAISDLSGIAKSGWGIVIIGLITAIVVVLIIIVAYKSALKKAEKKATHEGLKEWIQKAKAMGHNDKNIHKMLTQHGWDSHVVHKAIRDVSDRPL